MAAENREKNRSNVENLIPYQFKPGESGNPGGRPKKRPITDYVREQLENQIPTAMRAKLPAAFVEVYGESATFGQMLAFQMVAKAATGEMHAMREVLDRVEGKVSQRLASDETNSIQLTVRRIDVDL